MPALLSFSRLRSRRASPGTEDTKASFKIDGGSTPQTFYSATVATGLEKAQANDEAPALSHLSSKRPKAAGPTKIRSEFPDREKLTRLRQTLGKVCSMLDEVDDTILDILQESDGELDQPGSSGSAGSSVNPLAVSIDLHLADLQHNSRALCKLISQYRPAKRQESEASGSTAGCGLDKSLASTDAENESCTRAVSSPTDLSEQSAIHQFPRWCLPIPDFGDFFGPASLGADDSFSVCNHEFSQDFEGSSSTLQGDDDQQISSSMGPLCCVAPLTLPGRGFSVGPASPPPLQIGHRRPAPSSPFEYELGYLERQISEFSDTMRRQSYDLHQLFNIVQRPLNIHGTESSRASWSFDELALDIASSLGAHAVVSAGTTSASERLSSVSPSGLDPIGEFEADFSEFRPNRPQLAWRSRHFSTVEKTRRLRIKRRHSTPTGLSVELDEPLRMEELLAYLREGNSIREL